MIKIFSFLLVLLFITTAGDRPAFAVPQATKYYPTAEDRPTGEDRPTADGRPTGEDRRIAGNDFPSGRRLAMQTVHSDSVPEINAGLVRVEDLLWDLERLSVPPRVTWIDQSGPVRGLLYESVGYEGKPTEVFAWYSNPDLLAGRPAGEKRYPGVVLVHGGGGMAFKAWVEKWAADGYAAIAMDLSGNGPDGRKLEHPGADQDDGNKFAKIERGPLKNVWTYHAVASVLLAHSLLLSRPEVDTGKTCITGISWGGYLTCIAASLDNRFKAAAPVYGCAYYDESDFFGQPIRELSGGMAQKWMSYFDPSVYMPYAQPPFLFVNGNKDRFYNVVPYHKSYGLIAPGKRTICIKPDMAHSHVDGWAPWEIRYFFESVINEGPPLPAIGPVEIENDTLSVPFRSPVSLASAQFYYSNDTVSANEQRTWKVQQAGLDLQRGMASCPIPPEGFKYGFFYLKDHRQLTVSSEFIVNDQKNNQPLKQ